MLVHVRRCMEASVPRGEIAVLMDLDLRNAFPSFEWSAVRRAVDQHAPTLAGWTAWCHGGLRASSYPLEVGWLAIAGRSKGTRLVQRTVGLFCSNAKPRGAAP